MAGHASSVFSSHLLLNFEGSPGASPIKILQNKFYAMLILNHPDWLINLSRQSECLKNV